MRLDAAIEYSIQRSTTKDLKPLKPKHIQNITMATAQRDVQMSDLFKCLGGRMKESSSIIALKALLLTHIMIREGSHERVLGYLASNPGLIDMYHLKDKHDQLRNVREYSVFLEERIAAYKSVKEDFVKGKAAMITYYKQEPLDEQKLKSIQSLQKLIQAGIGCECFVEDWQSNNSIQIQAFRLIAGDMIGLFHLLNEAVLRLLAGFFELEKPLAKLGLEIYKSFVDLSKRTTSFFEKAGRVSAEIGLRIPTFKQAPASLANTLSDHIKSPNFDEQRVIAREQRALKAIEGKKTKKGHKSKGNLSKSSSTASLGSETSLDSSVSVKEKAPKDNEDLRKKVLKADPVLVDFFASIDDEVQAFEADTNQGQYADVGGIWYPQEFGLQDVSPHGSSFGLAENAKTQNQIQKQLEQTEQMFASAGFSLQPAGSGFPAPLSNQSSFNGIPNNGPRDVSSNPFSSLNAPYNPPSQAAQQTSAFSSGNNYSQSYGSSQMPFGQSPYSGMQPQQLLNQPAVFQTQPFGVPQTQAFGAPIPQSAFINQPAPNNGISQISAHQTSTPFNPFGTSPNPSGQPLNSKAFGNNSSNPAAILGQIQPQSTPYSTFPRTNSNQPAVNSTQQAGLFGDLASLDLSYNSKSGQNPKPADPFGQNFGSSAKPQQASVPVNSTNIGPYSGVPVHSSNTGPFGGMQMANDPFNSLGGPQVPFGNMNVSKPFAGPQVPSGNMNVSNPFGGPQVSSGNMNVSNPFGGPQVSSGNMNVSNPFGGPQALSGNTNLSNPFGGPPAPPGNMNASNPFGNLDFGGQQRTASNTNGNYIVNSSSNAQPQALFEPRSASDPFSRPQPNQQINPDFFAQDPFAMPVKNNSHNAFGFQQK